MLGLVLIELTDALYRADYKADPLQVLGLGQAC